MGRVVGVGKISVAVTAEGVFNFMNDVAHVVEFNVVDRVVNRSNVKSM
jgi:hypothetical protein